MQVTEQFEDVINTYISVPSKWLHLPSFEDSKFRRLIYDQLDDVWWIADDLISYCKQCWIYAVFHVICTKFLKGSLSWLGNIGLVNQLISTLNLQAPNYELHMANVYSVL